MSAPNEYQIVLKDPNGTTLAYLDNFAALEITRSVNGIGALSILMPNLDYGTANTYDKFLTDGRIEVWRSVAGGPMALHGDTCYFIRYKRPRLEADGSYSFLIRGEDAVSLLGRRYNLWYANDANSKFSSTAYDNALKAIFAANFGASSGTGPSGTGRDWSAYMSAQTNLTAAPTGSKEYAWRNVLTIMQEVALASAEAGTYLAFDLIWTGTAFEYRTYINQRGIDRRWSSGNTLVISPENGTLGEAELEEDWSEEKTYILAAGYGTETGRVIGTATDSARVGISPFGRIEHFMQTAGADSTSLTVEANAQLRKMRPKVTFSGKLIQTDGVQYGRDYSFGDYLTAQFMGKTFNARLDTVRIQVGGGLETIDAILRQED